LHASIDETNAERVLEIGNYLRNGGLRNAELLRRLGHAASLNDCREYMQISQPEAPADLTFPVDFSKHREVLWGAN
jgi:hypothetical protein